MDSLTVIDSNQELNITSMLFMFVYVYVFINFDFNLLFHY